MTRFETLILDLKAHVGEGVEPALKFLEQILSTASDNYNDFIQLKGRYTNLQREFLLGLLATADYEEARLEISQSLLLLADTLQENDLKPELAPPAPSADKRGEILYRIPDRMQLQREEKCTVRLAWILQHLLRDWEKEEVDVVRDIRMAEVMGVQLLNVDENNPFAIRTISETVQFVDKDDFTEWIFYVRPLLAGEFPLVLRVSVIEMINGREIKKDIVLEEQVLVVAEGTPEIPETYKKADEGLVVAGLAGSRAGAQAVEEESGAAPPSEKKRRAGKWLGIALSTVALATLATLIGINYFKETPLSVEPQKDPPAQDSVTEMPPPPPPPVDTVESLPDTVRSSVPPETTRAAPATPRQQWQTAQNNQRSRRQTTPSPRKTEPQPPVSNPPAKTEPKPPAVQPAAPPTLDGGTGFGMNPFLVVRQGSTEFEILFLEYNARQAMVTLTGQSDWTMRTGQDLIFVLADEQTVATRISYVSETQNGKASGYFLLERADLEKLARGKVLYLRLRDNLRPGLKGYELSDNARKRLKDRVESALKKMARK